MVSRTRLPGLALLLGLHGAPLSGQQAPDRPPSIGTSTDLVLVDVIVSDRRGRLLRDLPREEFLVFEDGQPVEVAAFRAPSPSTQPAAAAATQAGTTQAAARLTVAEPATVVFYLENSTLTAGGRRQALEAVRSFIGEHLPPGAFRALVIAEGGGARTTTTVTTNVAEVEGALDAVARTTGGGALTRSDERQVLDMMRAIIETCEYAGCGGCLGVLDEVLGVARAHAEARTRVLSQTIARLSAAVGALASLPGRKALVYVSEDFEQRPGMHLFHQIGEICPQALLKDFSRVYGPMEEHDVTAVLRELAARANAARVTLYPLDAGGLQGHSVGDVSFAERRYTPSPRTDSIRAANVRATQELLAQETGGFAIVGTNDPSGLLGRLPDELAARYDLGFAPAQGPDGRWHSIKVRLRHGKGLDLRYRASYLHTSRGIREGDRVLATLLYGLEEDGLGAIVTAEIAPASPAREGARVAVVHITVPLARLATEPAGNGRRARVRFLVAVRRADAGPADPPLQLREKQVDLQLAMGDSAAATREVVVDIPLGEGEHDVAVGIHDALSSGASYRRLHLR